MMPDILIIDDTEVMRLNAQHELRRYRHRILIPEQSSELADIDPHQFSLIIIDRFLLNGWKSATREFMKRVPHGIEIWEWTAGAGLPIDTDHITRATKILGKERGALYDAVHQWASACVTN